MKKIIIVIHNLEIGGAQRSLLSFLQCLQKSKITENYEIDLLPIKYSGDFISQIPDYVHLLEPDLFLRWMGSDVNPAFVRGYFSIKALIREAVWIIRNKLGLFDKDLNTLQKLWTVWKRAVPVNEKKYDVAVSYMDGCSSYYVMDKINAAKKVLWVHSEYRKQGYSVPFDQPYYEKCDRIITISEHCKECLCEAFPTLHSKVDILENITVADSVIEKSKAACGEFSKPNALKLLSVGRLHEQKGMDIAVRAARVLKDSGRNFEWLIIGEGHERSALQDLIDELELNENVFLLGAKDNPYASMKECDLLVQPSRVEGKSIVLDEAKILCRPIVATNYATVRDAIEHEKTGLIVEMNAEALADGIIKLAQDANMRNVFSENLRKAFKGNEAELQRYMDIML